MDYKFSYKVRLPCLNNVNDSLLHYINAASLHNHVMPSADCTSIMLIIILTSQLIVINFLSMCQHEY